MKFLSLIVLFSAITIPLNSQVITGKVLDSSSGEPLEYVSIGVINTSLGTITDQNGNFKINVNGQSPESMVRISMISYKPQSFTIAEFTPEKVVQLISTPTSLAEVVVRPSGKSRKVGTMGYTKIGNWCGWGGTYFGKGREIGTKIELGNTPVQIKSLHIRLHRQAFDSSIYRLHIRTIVNNVPFDELLNSNIMLTVTKESGWVDFDLRKYNIVLRGDVVLSLEWVKVIGIIKKREMKINNKLTSDYVLFNSKRNRGCIYMRLATESKWKVIDTGSPSFYLTIQE